MRWEIEVDEIIYRYGFKEVEKFVASFIVGKDYRTLSKVNRKTLSALSCATICKFRKLFFS
jgi:hypothetical protein